MFHSISPRFTLLLSALSLVSPLQVKIGSNAIAGTALVAKLQPIVKLPVWPVWSGVGAQIADWMNLKPVSRYIVNRIGGRVIPMHLSEHENSPFLMLVHHSHSFAAMDPFRYISGLLLPEGFPAHPHAGFDTVTICLEGGLKHRDSEGESMAYGDGDTQWMRAGKGVIHEEMWNLDALAAHTEKRSPKPWQRIEIFQLWVNLPKKHKDYPPAVHLLRATNTPLLECSNGASVRVICGDVVADAGGPAGDAHGGEIQRAHNAENIAASPMNILQVVVPANEKLHLSFPGSKACSTLCYVRRGSLLLQDSTILLNQPREIQQETLLTYSPPASHIEHARPSDTGTDVLALQASRAGLDALVLVGEKLNESVHWQGPIVQADEESLRRSAAAFNSLPGGAYWEQSLTDAEWRQRLKQLRLQDRLTNKQQ